MKYAMTAEATIEEVARLNHIDVFYESGLLGAVAKGHRARRGRLNPYKMKAHFMAWQFGADRWLESWDQTQADWLRHRRQDGERLTAIMQRCSPKPMPTPVQPMADQGHGAKIIPFPVNRIVRRIEHGAPVVVEAEGVPKDAA
jgi:hypothetical protein